MVRDTEKKHETMTLVSGDATVWIQRGDSLSAHDLARGPVEIQPNVIHWVTTETGAKICEVSTDDLDDVVRLHDLYGRA